MLSLQPDHLQRRPALIYTMFFTVLSVLPLSSRIDLSNNSTLSMYSIKLGISSSSSATFGIQSAVVAYQSSGTLYTKGCNDQDCSVACLDPNQIFSNPYTLQNCMVLSALAPNPWTQALGANLSEESVKTASQFAIDTTSPGFHILASNITQTIQGCLEEYCNPQNCSENYESWTSLPWYSIFTDYQHDTNTTGVPVYTFTCPYDVEPLNADIGGIGVR